MNSSEEIILTEGRLLIDWLMAMQYVGGEKIQIVVNTEDVTRIRIFTSDHSYQISARPTYLGCQAGTRKPRAGEEHNRGNDLPDGKFSRGTFVRIIGAIVGYELKTLEVDEGRVADEEEVKSDAAEQTG